MLNNHRPNATHDKYEHLYRTIVELGGGVFRGVQKGDATIGLKPLVLFDGPSRSTLAIHTDKLSARAVRAAIAAKEAEYAAAYDRYAEKAALFVLRQFAQKAA